MYGHPADAGHRIGCCGDQRCDRLIVRELVEQAEAVEPDSRIRVLERRQEVRGGWGCASVA